MNMSSAQFESEYLLIASPNNTRTAFRTAVSSTSEVPCVVTGLGDEEEGAASSVRGLQGVGTVTENDGFPLYIMDPQVDGQGGYIDLPIDAA